MRSPHTVQRMQIYTFFKKQAIKKYNFSPPEGDGDGMEFLCAAKKVINRAAATGNVSRQPPEGIGTVVVYYCMYACYVLFTAE